MGRMLIVVHDSIGGVLLLAEDPMYGGLVLLELEGKCLLI